MDGAYVPLALVVDLGGGAGVACKVIHNRGNRDKSLRIGALLLLNAGMQPPKVVSVIVCDDVPINTGPSNPGEDDRDGAACCMRFLIKTIIK